MLLKFPVTEPSLSGIPETPERISTGDGMAVGKAEKAAYNDEIKDVTRSIEDYYKKIKEIDAKKNKLKNIEGYYNIEKADYFMKIIIQYMKMSDLSLEMLKIKNEKFLNEARKEFYKVLQVMESVVGGDVDRTLKENDKYLEKIDRFNPQQVLDLARKMHDVFNDLRFRVGESSKWKWSFVELQARAAVIIKNITSFSDIAKLRDPRTPFYYERRELMQMCKDSLNEAAKQYRTKYELSGKARDDLMKSIELLSALRKVHVLFGESDEANKLKITIDALKQNLEAEDAAQDKKKQKNN